MSQINYFINNTACSICNHQLYWTAKLAYDNDISEDYLLLTSECCGKYFEGVVDDNTDKISLFETDL